MAKFWSRSRLKKLGERARANAVRHAEAPHDLARTRAGTIPALRQPRKIWAVLTSDTGDGSYLFTQKVGTPGGGWATPPKPIVGLEDEFGKGNAWEANATTDLSGRVVLLRYDEDAHEWRFTWRGVAYPCKTTYCIKVRSLCGGAPVLGATMTFHFDDEPTEVIISTDASGRACSQDDRLGTTGSVGRLEVPGHSCFLDHAVFVPKCSRKCEVFFACAGSLTVNVIVKISGTADDLAVGTSAGGMVLSHTGGNTYYGEACEIGQYPPIGGDIHVHPLDSYLVQEMPGDSDFVTPAAIACGNFVWCCEDKVLNIRVWGKENGIWIWRNWPCPNCVPPACMRPDSDDMTGLGYVKKTLFCYLVQTAIMRGPIGRGPGGSPPGDTCSLFGVFNNTAITLTYFPGTDDWRACVSGNCGDYYCIDLPFGGGHSGGILPVDPTAPDGTNPSTAGIGDGGFVYSKRQYNSMLVVWKGCVDGSAHLYVERFYDSACTNFTTSDCSGNFTLWGDCGTGFEILFGGQGAGDYCTPTNVLYEYGVDFSNPAGFAQALISEV